VASKHHTKKKYGLTFKIIAGMVAGLALGLILNMIGPATFINDFIINGVLHIGGKIFLASLKLLVVPLVFVSLTCGTASLDDIKKLGRIGGKTLALYLFTTALAISIAVCMAIVMKPGVGFNLMTDATFNPKDTPSLTQTIIDIFPNNPVAAMAEGKMLQIIVFAVLFGLTLTMVGKPGERILNIFKDLNAVILKMVMLIMAVAPYGVFCLIAKVFALQGFAAIAPLAKYFFVVVFALLLHVFGVYPILLKLLSGLSPLTFFKKYKDVPMFAFSTASSNATLPITLETVEHKLGVKNSIASFTIPLGATVNMDGSAIMQGVAAIFISQAYNLDIGLSGYLMVIFTATLASIGTAAVPGAALIMLAMVLKQVGLPIEGIALIIGVDRLLDMARTAVNVTGDAAVSCIVAKSEKQFSQEIFYAEDSKKEF
jgi:Na+/H+-dicarboxylate symporter